MGVQRYLALETAHDVSLPEFPTQTGVQGPGVLHTTRLRSTRNHALSTSWGISWGFTMSRAVSTTTMCYYPSHDLMPLSEVSTARCEGDPVGGVHDISTLTGRGSVGEPRMRKASSIVATLTAWGPVGEPRMMKKANSTGRLLPPGRGVSTKTNHKRVIGCTIIHEHSGESIECCIHTEDTIAAGSCL